MAAIVKVTKKLTDKSNLPNYEILFEVISEKKGLFGKIKTTTDHVVFSRTYLGDSFKESWRWENGKQLTSPQVQRILYLYAAQLKGA